MDNEKISFCISVFHSFQNILKTGIFQQQKETTKAYVRADERFIEFYETGEWILINFDFFQTLCKRALRQQSQPKHLPSAGVREKAAATQRSKTQSKYYLETPAITATTSSNVRVCLLRNIFFTKSNVLLYFFFRKITLLIQIQKLKSRNILFY